MNFTLIFPTRERTHLLQNLCKSIDATTSDKKSIEVFAGYDLDDRQTINVVHQLTSQYPWLHMKGRNRTRNLTRDYINWMYSFSKGKYIIVMNDDCAFRTPNWDQIALRKLDDYLRDKPDGVVYGWISDSLIDRAGGVNYSCFPLVSRRAVDALGYVMNPFFPGWNADIHLFHLYNSVGRVLSISEVHIDHISYHANKASRDRTSHNMESISREAGTHVDINSDKNKLAKYIEAHREVIDRQSHCSFWSKSEVIEPELYETGFRINFFLDFLETGVENKTEATILV